MPRKFSELTPSEQIQFQGLVDFMKETWNEDIGVKLNIVKKFHLDIKDPVVYDFLTDVYVPQPRPDLLYDDSLSSTQPVHFTQKDQPYLPIAAPTAAEKTKAISYVNNKDLIIIQNRLLHAISHLTLNERRLILFLSPIVRKETSFDINKKRFVVKAIDFANEYNIAKEKSYQVLGKIADSILEKAFWFWNFKDNNSLREKTYKTGLVWVTKCDYVKTQGKIIVDLHEDVIEMLTIFDKTTGNYWTQYQKEWIVNLGSYGIVMLEMVLSSLQNGGYYTIEHLREKFDCMSSYPKFSNFRIWVIDKAIKEIKDHTPIKISYKIYKEGRTVTGLAFSYTDTRKKAIKDKEKKDVQIERKNPFVNFKMTQKQLSMFAGKIKKASDQDVEEIIAELSNVHLQSKHIDFLKVLDYVPSAWYSDDEIKEHPTSKQVVQMKKQAKKDKADKAKQEQEQLEHDFEKIVTYAEEFVMANLDRVTKSSIEGVHLKSKNYEGIVQAWKHNIIDPKWRKSFALVDEILAR